MNDGHNQRSATAEYWATVDRIGDGETVPSPAPQRSTVTWRLLSLAPGLFLIIAAVVGLLR